MSERDLRRRCRRLLNGLDIRPPLDVDELCRRFAQQRGRVIELVPYDIPVAGPFGLWVGDAVKDVIVYQQQTTPAHQRHIILHELGHIFAGHEICAPRELLATLRRGERHGSGAPLWLPADGDVLRLLGRSVYDDEHEREAETVATIILEWASVLDHVVPRTADQAPAQRMSVVLSDRLGWL
ncbi:hypothetical protein [Streptomyces sp. NPDC102360]|uniref:hypothetical protein n=1 Tax=Streptomyces sp. NPDC102360 TaxID=3366160 RepID=UPI00382BDE98